MQKTKLYYGVLAMFITLNVSASTVQEELALLKKQLNDIKNKITAIENKIEPEGNLPQPAPDNKARYAKSLQTSPIAPVEVKNKSMKVYASLRPTLGYLDENQEKSLDVKDALSNAGFKSTYNFQPGWTAILHGEWSIDLSDNADFGKARQVYAGVDTPYGKVTIGKQRPVQYLLIAEYSDIFDHSNSPYAYDVESPFFVNNLLSYQLQQGDFTWMITSQFNGSEGKNNADMINGGLSYDKNGLHLATTYLEQSVYEAGTKLGDDKVYAMSIAYTFANDFYAAVAYQDKDYERETMIDRSGHTFDLSVAYPLSNNYIIKAGYFDFKDGEVNSFTKDHDGGNLTLEWLPNNDVKFHIEYLYRNFDELADFSSISVGLRYDYAQIWNF